ncbi:MAG: SDR family oxidoreductase, partial [Xenococcaceae cyanobacterium]
GLLNFRSTIATQNTFYAAASDARVSAVDVRDIAEVAVAALTETGHEGKIYDLTGLQALTHAEMAQHLSAAIGRQIAFVDVSPESMHDFLLSAKFPLWQADGLLEEYAHYRRNEAATIAFGVRDAIGKNPRNFEAFTRDYATVFS